MMAELKQLIHSCPQCLELAPSAPKQPLQPSTSSYPMQTVGLDLFQALGSHYLVMMDRYSGFPFVARLNKLTTSAVLNVLDNWFLDFGYPETIRSDGGPQFRSEFEAYCKEKKIAKETSSAYYPQSNGLAEAAVKQMKYLLLKYDGNMRSFKTALLHWRNTPKSDGTSPAQMFFGQAQNFGLPQLTPPSTVDRPLVKADRDRSEANSKARFDEHAHPLQPFSLGDPKSKNWTDIGTIIKSRSSGQSYEVQFDDGFVSPRNKRHLRTAPAPKTAKTAKQVTWGGEETHAY